MVKQTKFLRKQARKAEQMARTTKDKDISQDFSALALAYRSQADVLKESRRKQKSTPDDADKSGRKGR